MKYLKLFLLLLFLSQNKLVYSAENKPVANNTQKLTQSQKTKKIIRKSIAKKKNDKIRKQNEEAKNIYNISRKTINLKSPMCKYAKDNDVLSLKKTLLASNYNESEVNTICENGETLLMIAVKNNNFLSAKFLLEKGADVNLANEANTTPLHISARKDTPEIDRIFEIIIRNKKLNINAKDKDGYTPLMRAVEFEKVSFIKQIMKLKPDLEVKNVYGKNVFHLAQKVYEGKKTDEERAISEHIINLLKGDV